MNDLSVKAAEIIPKGFEKAAKRPSRVNGWYALKP